MQVIDGEYLPVLQKRFKAALVRDALAPDLQPLGDVCEALGQVKQRVAACRGGNLRVTLPTGGLTTPGVFTHDVIHELRWSEWETAVQNALERTNAYARTA